MDIQMTSVATNELAFYCYISQQSCCFFEEAGIVYYADLDSNMFQPSTTFPTVEEFQKERMNRLIRITDEKKIEEYNQFIAEKRKIILADTQSPSPPKEPDFFQPHSGHNIKNCYYEREGRVFWINLDQRHFMESACYTKDKHIDFLNDVKTGKLQKITNADILEKIRLYLKELVRNEKI